MKLIFDANNIQRYQNKKEHLSLMHNNHTGQ